MRPPGWSRLADLGFIAFLASCVLGAGAALLYHGTRLEHEAAQTQRRLLAAETHHNLDHLVQTLNALDLTLGSLLETGHASHGTDTWNALLRDALRHAPHLRSLSLLDEQGRVIASSSQHNIGLQPALDDYLPEVPQWADVLRLGTLHAGRDLASGRKVVDPAAEPPALAFVPAVRSLHKGEAGRLSLLAALNVDYFLTHFTQHEQTVQGWVDVLRYDGSLLFSTREHAHDAAAAQANRALAARWQGGEELGSVDEQIGATTHLTAWRMARILPIGVVARLPLADATAAARAESRQQLYILLPLIGLAFGLVLLAYLLARRSTRQQMDSQARDFDRMARLLDALPACVLLFGRNGRTLLTNHAWQEFAAGRAGFGPGNAVHFRDYANLFRHDGAQPENAAEEGIRSVLLGEVAAFDGEFELCAGQGGQVFQLMVRPFVRDGMQGIAVLQLDVSARRQAEERNRLLHAALDAAANAVVITDTSATIEWSNPAFTALTGFCADEALGRKPKELIKSGRQNAEFYGALWDTILRGEVWRGEVVNKRKDGQLYDEALTITPVRDRNGRLAHFVAVKEDITARKRQEHELQRLASTDPLTGVRNRRAFMERLEAELARVRRYGKPAALLMLDLDHFKRVNDSYGHAAGDTVLRQFAALVRAALRQTDSFGRLGGEEFAVLLPETELSGAAELAERMRAQLERTPIEAGGQALHITASIGLTLLESTDPHADTALARADDALYRAKSMGRNRVEYGGAPA